MPLIVSRILFLLLPEGYMEAFWILPNRHQKQSLEVLSPEGIRNFREVISPAERPPGLALGIPAEVYNKTQEVDKILLCQYFPEWRPHKNLLLISSPAGTDQNGRIVHLSLMMILSSGERPVFNIQTEGMSLEDKSYADNLLHRLKEPGDHDLWRESVLTLLKKLLQLSRNTINIDLKFSTIDFAALYELDQQGILKKKSKATILIPFLLLAIVSLLLLAMYW